MRSTSANVLATSAQGSTRIATAELGIKDGLGHLLLRLVMPPE